jgi:hypothetical protein
VWFASATGHSSQNRRKGSRSRISAAAPPARSASAHPP